MFWYIVIGYLISIIFSWLLIKLGLIIDNDLVPVPFWVIVYLFLPLFNIVTGFAIFISGICSWLNENYDIQLIKNKIIHWFKLD